MRVFFDIRTRMMLAALLPLALVAILLVSVLLLLRFDDLQESYEQRNRVVAKNLALASEFGLFTANRRQLQALAQGALDEADLRWISILNDRGQMLVSAGDAPSGFLRPLGALQTQGFDVGRQLDWLTQPVMANDIRIDDLFDGNMHADNQVPKQQGQVVLAFSRKSLNQRQQEMLFVGGGIGLLSLIFGFVLASYLSRTVTRPVARITKLIEHIGEGDFAAAKELRSQIATNDPLHELQSHIDRMTDRLIVARDDLEQKVTAATQALREKKDEAENANLAKSRFLAVASHDLRQPTHALGMFVSRLAQLPHDAQTIALIGNLQASVQAMQTLLDGLLDLSRLEAQSVPVSLRAFPLSGVFDQLRLDFSRLAQDKGLSLRIRTTDLWAMSDAALVYRILLNLVGNALRYTKQGGVLVVARPMCNQQDLQIQVWDTGIGIAPQHQAAIFTEFFQVANTGRDRSMGLGLGLNIVQRTAALLSIPLALTSHLGRGSRFTLTLPRVAGQLNVLADVPPENVLMDGFVGLLALVIEDDSLVRLALVGLLESWGFRVSQAQGWQQARQKVTDGVRPDVIISDYRLQDEHDGIDVIEQLRFDLGLSVPACLISGDTDVGLGRAAQQAGLTLLHKPVRPAKLRSLLRRLLRDQRADATDMS